MSVQESKRSLQRVLPPIKANNKTGGEIAKDVGLNSKNDARLSNRKQTDCLLPVRHNNVVGESGTAPLAAKLGTLEAQRVISVLDELKHKVNLQILIPDVVDKKKLAGFSPEVVEQLQNYRHLCNQVDHDILKTDDGENTIERLKASSRTLKRLLVQTPNLISRLQTIIPSRSNSDEILDSLLEQLRDILYERLCTAVEDDQQRRDTLARISAQEYRMTSELQNLLEELDKAKQERVTEVTKCNIQIRKLKEELRELKQQATENLNQLKAKSQNSEMKERRATQKVQNELGEDISRLRASNEEAQRVNREEELTLRKRIFKIETEVENWVHKYDVDMEEKQVEIDDITAIYAEEKQELDQLTLRFNELKTEYDGIMDTKRKKQQKEKEEQELLVLQTQAATKIQALWRGYKVRHNIKKKGKGGSSKKKVKGSAKSNKSSK